jgi:peroxiredoxin Q/BCP
MQKLHASSIPDLVLCRCGARGLAGAARRELAFLGFAPYDGCGASPMFNQRSTVQPGSRAPEFTLPDQDGALVRLSALLEKGPVVVYFYPKDETLGCTLEACQFRDRHARFTSASATIVGISDDTVEQHRAFREHHGLPFILLSDRGGAIRKLYGVKKTLGLVPGRATFVIDSEAIVRHVFVSQLRAFQHVEEALRAVEALPRPRRAPTGRGA